MKKRGLCALAIALVLMAMPTAAGAAISPSGSGSQTESSGGSGGGGGSSSSGSSSGSGQTGSAASSTGTQSGAGVSSGTVITSGIVLDVSADGEKLTVVEKGTDSSGATISLVVNTKTTYGTDILPTKEGHAQIEKAFVSIAVDVAETAGLPQYIVDMINKLNSGADISIAAPDKHGYISAGGTRAIVSKDENGIDIATEITVKVDYLVGAREILVVYYNNNTNRWEIANVHSFNPKNGVVVFDIPGSVTVKFAKKL